jgi:hypothetical protein
MNHGTILELNELNTIWDENNIRELRVSLSRLLSPITPAEDFLNRIKNFLKD